MLGSHRGASGASIGGEPLVQLQEDLLSEPGLCLEFVKLECHSADFLAHFPYYYNEFNDNASLQERIAPFVTSVRNTRRKSLSLMSGKGCFVYCPNNATYIFPMYENT